MQMVLRCRHGGSACESERSSAPARRSSRPRCKLFDERGFEQTTIADIAAAADIAPRTFFGYFPSKEDVVFADFEDDFDGLAARLTDRSEDETAIDASRLDHGAARGEGPDRRARALSKARDRRVAGAGRSPARPDGTIEELLAEHIARDLGDRPDDVRPRMIASAVIGALAAVDVKGETATPSREEALAMVDEALTFLRGGLEALRRSDAGHASGAQSSRCNRESAIRRSSCSTLQLGSAWWATLTSAAVGRPAGSGQVAGSQSFERTNAFGQCA